MNEHVQPALWGIDELAGFLRKHKTTVYSDLRRRPGAVPPPIRLPGSSKLLWDPAFVMEWLRQFQTGITPPHETPGAGGAAALPVVPIKRGRGRPPKGVTHG